jgi:hypothetical protein
MRTASHSIRCRVCEPAALTPEATDKPSAFDGERSPEITQKAPGLTAPDSACGGWGFGGRQMICPKTTISKKTTNSDD